MKFNQLTQRALALLHDLHLVGELSHIKVDKRSVESTERAITRSARNNAIVTSVNNAIADGCGKHTSEGGAYYVVAQEFNRTPEAICKVYVKNCGK